jgi:hypothetical protein
MLLISGLNHVEYCLSLHYSILYAAMEDANDEQRGWTDGGITESPRLPEGIDAHKLLFGFLISSFTIFGFFRKKYSNHCATVS